MVYINLAEGNVIIIHKIPMTKYDCSIFRVGAKYFEKDLSKFQVQSQCTCT